MATRSKAKAGAVVPGGVDEYIARCPEAVQAPLRDMRSAIRHVAPDATETMSYFEMRGYAYPGYDYNGMFAWFSFKAPHIRLHVRPPVLEEHGKEIAGTRRPRRSSASRPTARCPPRW